MSPFLAASCREVDMRGVTASPFSVQFFPAGLGVHMYPGAICNPDIVNSFGDAAAMARLYVVEVRVLRPEHPHCVYLAKAVGSRSYNAGDSDGEKR